MCQAGIWSYSNWSSANREFVSVAKIKKVLWQTWVLAYLGVGFKVEGERKSSSTDSCCEQSWTTKCSDRLWQTAFGPYIQQSWAAHKSVFDYVICVKTWYYSGLLGFRRDFNHPRWIQINGDYPWMSTYSFQTNHRAFDTTHVFMWLELLRWPGCRHVGRVPEGKVFFRCIEPCVFKCRSVKQRLGLQCTMFTRLAVKPLVTLMRIKINMSSLLYTKYKSGKSLGHESGITLLWQISTLLSTYLWRNIFVWAKCDTSYTSCPPGLAYRRRAGILPRSAQARLILVDLWALWEMSAVVLVHQIYLQ